MDFTLKFKLDSKDGYHIIGTTNHAGMDAVREIRSTFGLEEVPLSQINILHNCPRWNHGGIIEIEVPDQIVDSIRHFDAKGEVYVTVPDGFMGRFWKANLSTKCMYKPYLLRTKKWKYEHTQYNISYGLDEKEILRDWIAAGTPLRWSLGVLPERFTFMVNGGWLDPKIKAANLYEALTVLQFEYPNEWKDILRTATIFMPLAEFEKLHGNES